MIDLEPPRDLCVPVPGAGTFARIYGLAVRRLLAELLRLARALGEDSGLAAVGRVLSRVRAEEPGALASLACLPTVGVLVRGLREPLVAATRRRYLNELAATLALELAHAGLLAAPLVLADPPREIVALGARRRARVLEGESRITILPSGEVRGAEQDSPYSPLTGGILFAQADNNPLRMLEAHPDKAGNAIDLGGRSLAEWTGALVRALDAIGAHLPAFRAEIALVLRQMIPVGFFEEAHLSASYQEAIGTVYLSLHKSPLTMAEAIVHEVSHNKINALLELDPIIENDRDERYASPVRPDPRPIHGVLLAVHAFLPVARLYEQMLEAGAGESAGEIEHHLARVRRLNAQGAEVLLAHGRPTAIGRGVFEEIEREVARARD